jgi:hypothetical protein
MGIKRFPGMWNELMRVRFVGSDSMFTLWEKACQGMGLALILTEEAPLLRITDLTILGHRMLGECRFG